MLFDLDERDFLDRHLQNRDHFAAIIPFLSVFETLRSLRLCERQSFMIEECGHRD